MENQVTTDYRSKGLLLKILPFIPTLSAIQKQKPQIDGLFLNVLHTYGQEKPFNGKPGYYRYSW